VIGPTPIRKLLAKRLSPPIYTWPQEPPRKRSGAGPRLNGPLTSVTDHWDGSRAISIIPPVLKPGKRPKRGAEGPSACSGGPPINPLFQTHLVALEKKRWPSPQPAGEPGPAAASQIPQSERAQKPIPLPLPGGGKYLARRPNHPFGGTVGPGTFNQRGLDGRGGPSLQGLKTTDKVLGPHGQLTTFVPSAPSGPNRSKENRIPGATKARLGRPILTPRFIRSNPKRLRWPGVPDKIIPTLAGNYRLQPGPSPSAAWAKTYYGGPNFQRKTFDLDPNRSWFGWTWQGGTFTTTLAPAHRGQLPEFCSATQPRIFKTPSF